jgi:hypothetical protein
MLNKPEYDIELIIGARETGKSAYVVGNEEFNVIGTLVQNMLSGRPAIILDQIFHPKYEGFAVIPKEKLLTHKITKGIYRIIEPTKKGLQQAEGIIATTQTDIDVYLEDTRRYERDELSDGGSQLFGNSKNVRQRLKCMYHNWRHVPKDIIMYADVLTLFKTSNPPGKREANEFADRFDEVMELYNEVQAHPSKFFRKSIIVSQ